MVNEVQVNGNQGLPSGIQTNPWALEEEAVHENYHQNSIEGRRHFLSKGANVDTLWYSVFAQERGGSSFGALYPIEHQCWKPGAARYYMYSGNTHTRQLHCQ